MSSNFHFIKPHWPALAELAEHAEKYTFDDPQSSLIKLRCYAEKLTGIIYREFSLPCLANDKFMDRLEAHAFASMVDSAIIDKLHAIRIKGNKAAHEGTIGKGDSQWLLKEAHLLACWLFLTFKKGPANELSKFVVPQPVKQVEEQQQTEYLTKAFKGKLVEQEKRHERLLEELAKAEAAEQEAQRKAALLEKKLDEATTRQYKAQSDQAKNALELNEAQTRRRLIDTELHSRGWDIDLVTGKNTEEVTLEEEVDKQPTASGIGYVDYVLWDDNGKPLAVIEAKRTRESAEKGRQQAKLYADSLEAKYGQRPVIFYTNGYDISIWDDQQGYAPRKLYGFYSKSSLQYLMRQRQQRKDLNKTPIDTNIAGRDYQIETITRVCERFSDNHRKALVVQATGTGKTRVSIALTKRLMDASWAKRVLFLCDRKELRKQAGKAYTEFLSEPVYVVGKSNKADMKNARIYVATYPGMLSIMQQFDPGYFDLIIADESHRSIYNVFGDVFKYFDALQLGLTATPVEMISRSTSKLFGCDYKMPTANYPLEQAVEEGNLVPYKIVAHTTQFLREGIQGHSLTDEQIAELEDQGKDPNTLDFDAKVIDKAVYNKDTNRLILRNLMDNGLRLADGQTLGKSMIFARNIAHAELLAQLFDEMYPEYAKSTAGNFCRVIHSKYERAEELIDDFKASDGQQGRRTNNITIAISVDMLDTGIDVPEVLNLVFAKPVKSKVKFHQMIGRGTRLCADLFGPGKDKQKFLIFDHWANFDYFELDPEEEERQAPKSLSQKLFESRVAYADEALKKADMYSFDKMVVLIKQDIDSLDDDNINIKDNWQLKQHLSQLDVIHQFTPATKDHLLETMAGLMQWRNIQGQSDAIKLDMDIVNAQYANLIGSAKEDELRQCRENLTQKVRNLSMHLSQVRNHANTIAKIQDDNYWQTLSFDDLEQARINLRPIIHLQNKGATPPPEPLNIIDIKEDADAVITEERKTNIRTVDYEIYRQEVEKTLTPLFEKDPILQKIRAGQAITEQELANLNALVHTQNAKVDLQLLAEFFPESSAGIDQLLRTIVGLDTQAIEQQFMQFVQEHHIKLNSLQQRFINLLKREICRRGEITIADLYDQPFKSLHQDGIDGIFQDEATELIVQFIAGFTVEPGQQQRQVQTQVQSQTEEASV